MRIVLSLVAFIAAGTACPVSAGEAVSTGPAGAPDLKALIARFEDMYRSKSSVSRMEMKVVKPRRTRAYVMKAWTLGTEKALIVIEEPAREKGTATLKVDKNLWNYMPRISRTIRIPPSMMLGSWMGSDFTNDDIVRESSFIDDYKCGLGGRSSDPEGWTVVMKAKPGVVGLWDRMEVVFNDDGTIPLKAEYYDRKGRLSRTMRWTDVRDFGGRTIPAKMVLVPHDDKKKGYRTEMTYLELEFDGEVPEDTFSLARLERKQ